MRALVYLGKRHLELRDVPEPEPRPGEVVVRVATCGICGSDMHGYHGDDPRRVPPLIMGHEISGVVETGRRAGDRVAVNPLVTCGTCDACLAGRPQLCPDQRVVGLPPYAGGFAEKVAVPEGNLVRIPDGMDFRTASMAEPVAVAYHGVGLGERLSDRPLSASNVAVLGGGAIGLAVALVLLSRGCRTVRLGEVMPERAATVRAAHEAILVYEPGRSAEPADGSVDLVFDAVAAEATRRSAFRMVKRGGVIVHMGLLPGSGGVDVRGLTLKEVTLAGSYCYSMLDFRDSVDLLASGRLGSLGWAEQRSLHDGVAAFEDIDRGHVHKSKLILSNPSF